MRIVSLRGRTAPHFDSVQIEFPPGLVAVVAGDGRLRGAARRMLAGVEDGVQVSTLPRVPDPVLTRLPVVLRLALESGQATDDAEDVVEAGTRALAILDGLDRLEAARTRLVRMRGAPATHPGPRAEALMERIRALEGAPAELEALELELRALREDDAEITGDVDAATMTWMRERQDAETQLNTYRDRARELRARLSELEEKGEEAECPTCGRPLAEHRGSVVDDLRDEWESLVQDGSWWRRRREQLEGKPDRLQELESRALRLHAATEGMAEKVELARARVGELEEARLKLAERVGGGAAAELAPEGRGVSEAVWDAVDQVLARATRGLRTQSRDRLLDRMSRILVRMTGGRILSVRWLEAGRLDLFGVEGALHPPVDEDAAAAHVAARIAAAQTLAARAGTPFPPLLLGEAFDRLDDAVKIRTVELLRSMVGPVFEQILLVTRGEVVDFYPESFDAIMELRRDAISGPSVFRAVPAGLGPLRLG